MKVDRAFDIVLVTCKKMPSKIKTRKTSEKIKESDDPDLKLKQFERKIEKALIIIQKRIRGHLARKKMAKIRKVSSVWEYYKEFTQEGEVNSADPELLADCHEDPGHQMHHALLLEPHHVRDLLSAEPRS